jgi:integrase/recombinase XerD
MRKREIESSIKRRAKRKIEHPTSMSLQIDNYINWNVQRNLTPKTLESYAGHLGVFKLYLASNGHSLLCDEITEEDITDYLASQRNKGCKQTSINNVIATVRPFFNYLVEREIIPTNPMKKIRKGKCDSEIIIPFTPDDIKSLLKQCNRTTYVGYRDYCIMLTLYSTGMRISECLNVRIQDIDFKQDKIYITTTKNRHPRIVGLSKKLKTELQKFVQLCLNDCQPTDHLWQSQDGRPLAVRSLQQNITNYGETAGIRDKRVSPHTFRHSFAIEFLRNGGSTASLRTQLGHMSIATVEKYLYFADSHIIADTKRFNPLDNLAV